MFAVAKLGAVLVPLNPRLTGPDLQYTLRHSETVAAITAETLEGVDFLELFEDLLVQLPDLQYMITVGEEDLWYDDRIFQFEDLLSAGRGRDYSAQSVDPSEDLFAIVYTSGTTGKPKGVELTHANVLGVAESTAKVLGLSSSDRVVGVRPSSTYSALARGSWGPSSPGRRWSSRMTSRARAPWTISSVTGPPSIMVCPHSS